MPTPFSRKTAVAPALVSSKEVLSLSDLLHVEDRRGGLHLCVRFEQITAWQEEITPRHAEESLGIRVFLSNGETVSLLQVSSSYFTGVMREYYGAAFDAHFAENDYQTLHVRRAHVIGFSAKQGYTLHVLGQHQFSGIRLKASDLSSMLPMVRRQPEPATEPEAPMVPLQRFPVYSPEQSYAFEALVLHGGSLYRKAVRGSVAGDPLDDVASWTYIRTLEGNEPQRTGKVAPPRVGRNSDIAEFSVHGEYSHGDLVTFRGNTYRKMTRSTSSGQPDRSPADWDRIREPETLGLMRA